MLTSFRKPSTSGSVTLAVAVAVGATAMILFCYRATHQPQPMSLTIVLDRSGSKIPDCEAIGSLAADYFKRVPAASGSSITLMATGDKDRDFEPQRLLSENVPFIPPDPFVGADADAAPRQALRQRIVTACRHTVPANWSPIRRALQRGVEQAEALGCGKTLRCSITVDTDLVENVDKLDQPGLAPIPNTGIPVHFCGYADRHSSGNPRGVERFKQLWMKTMVEEPSFTPYCGSASDGTAMDTL